MTVEPTVFFVDDDPAMRASLELLLRSEEFRSEGYASAENFLDAADPLRPGCLILDLKLGGMNGLALQKELRSRDVLLPVIIITAYGEVPDVVEAMREGAFDFIEKPFQGEKLLALVRQAIDSDAQARGGIAERRELALRVASLTPRSREVMDLLVAGRTMKQIAVDLEVAVQTVHKHVSRILSRLQVDNVVELVGVVRKLEKRRHRPQQSHRNWATAGSANSRAAWHLPPATVDRQ